MELILDPPPEDSAGWSHRVLTAPRVAAIRALLDRRLAALRAGDIDRVDATYASWRRDHVRRARGAVGPDDDHRTRFYVESIERPARLSVTRVRLSYTGEGQRLPHPGTSTWPGAPAYVATLTNDAGEDFLWAVIYREPEEGPPQAFIEVPVFVSDPVGFVPPIDPRPPEQLFEAELRTALWIALQHYVGLLSGEVLRAVALECVPWHGRVLVHVLTGREVFDEAQTGKWDMASWRCSALTETPYGTWRGFEELGRRAQAIYEAAEEPRSAVEALCSRCVAALTSPQVRALLDESYTLADDFEFGVFEPDDPDQRNHCG